MTGTERNGKGVLQAASVLEAALAYHRAGLAVVPIRPDGSKAPALPAGHPYLRERPTEGELLRWFSPRRNGIGVVCGRVSGQLETVDFETEEVFRSWRELVEGRAPGLVDRLSLVRTPGHLGQPGMHARYRCPGAAIPGSTALAREPSREERGRPRVLIETRGEGGYAIAPGSPPACHPTGGTWEHVAGPDLCRLPCLHVREREMLLSCARELDRLGRPPGEAGSQGLFLRGAGGELSPAEAYNRDGPDWSELLCPHGWRLVRTAGGVRYWRRPGKDLGGWSATTGHCRSGDGGELLHVFTSNGGPFEQGRSYSKFNAYVLLNHGGDYEKAARRLSEREWEGGRRRGLGNGPSPPDAPAPEPDTGDPVAAVAESLGLLRDACARAACLTAEEDRRLRLLLHRLERNGKAK
jgi:putative DNA primase/helicase